ncbi:MAG TPA: YfhO family protein, partial [Bryobacteraceae bacterium]
AFFACFALIAAVQILPAYELGRLSLRWVGAANPITWNEKVPYTVFENFSLYPTAVLGIVLPGFQRESAIFIGVVIVALGLLGVARKSDERIVRILAAIGIGGLFLSLGARSLFHGVLYSLIPNFDKARSPSCAEAIFHVGIVVLAAYGLDALRASPARFSIRFLFLGAIFLYGSLIVLMTVRPAAGEEYILLSQTALVALLLAVIFLIWRTSPHSGFSSAVLVILLLLFELNNVTTHNYLPFAAAASLQKLGENRDIAAFLKGQPARPRVEVEEKEIPFNFGDWFGIDQMDGYQAGALKSIADVQGEWKYRALFATNYSISRNPARPDQTVAFQAQSGLKVFANPGAFPRARVVHAATGAANEQAVIAMVMNPATDLQRTVVLQGAAPQLEPCDAGSVEIKRYRPTHVVLRADVACRSMVVLGDAWFPGWKAYVDDKPAPIHAAYNVVRGVVVDAGQHEVALVYRPASLYTGAALALIGIAICAFLRFSRHGQWQT